MTKKKSINIRVTEEQLKKIKENSAELGLTVSAYLVFTATNLDIIGRLSRIEEKL